LHFPPPDCPDETGSKASASTCAPTPPATAGAGWSAACLMEVVHGDLADRSPRGVEWGSAPNDRARRR